MGMRKLVCFHAAASDYLLRSHVNATPSRASTYDARPVRTTAAYSNPGTLLLDQKAHDAPLPKVHRLIERIGEGRRLRSCPAVGRLSSRVGRVRPRGATLLRKLSLATLTSAEEFLIVGRQGFFVHDAPAAVYEDRSAEGKALATEVQ